MIHYPVDDNLKKAIEMILTDYPELRDDDRRLIANVWWWEAERKYMCDPEISFRRFISDFSQGVYTSPETIRRTRQKVQEQNIELRGNKYEQRQKAAQEIQGEIRFK